MIRLINEFLIKLGIKFGRINKDDPNQVADRIKSFEAINLRYYNINAVLMMTRNSFTIPVNIWPQVKGHFFYRGQICPKDKPFPGK